MPLKIAIISPKYPSRERHSFAFVHARAKLYRKQHHQVRVFVPSADSDEYEFESIPVFKNRDGILKEQLEIFDPDVLAVHYPCQPVIRFANLFDYPKVVWIHGHEILWNFRLRSTCSLLTALYKRLFILPRELIKIINVRKFLNTVQAVVFVSDWMKQTAERHAFRVLKNGVVIPNPVDVNLFQYKKPEHLNRAVSVRSFDNTKYGLDIAIRAFSGFSDVELHLYGTGRFERKFNNLIRRMGSNTRIFDKIFSHSEIPSLYHRYGFFVAPSRIEAQGLSMCEAMACGLPVIATRVGGIPEFVRDGKDGFLVPPNNPSKLKDAVQHLIADQERFSAFSKNARNQIIRTCSEKIVIEKEISLFRQAIGKSGSI